MLAVLPPVTLAGKAYSQHEQDTEVEEVRAFAAYAKDGTPVGTVADVRAGKEGETSYFHIRVGSHLGIGEKTVAVPSELTITLRGAVVVELTADEIARLRAVDEGN